MKQKLFLWTFVMLFIGHLTIGQIPFNRKIEHSYFIDPPATSLSKQTIAHDAKQNIVFLSYSDTTTGHSYQNINDFEIVKLNSNGKFVKAIRIKNTDDYILTPRCIIPTINNDRYLVVGDYEGIVQSNYPSIAVNPLRTIFYALFDSNLGLLGFNLHYGFPYNDPSIDPTQVALNADGVASALDHGQEYFFIYSVVSGTSSEILLTKVDAGLNPVIETHVAPPYGLGISGYVGCIDYLPNNGVFSVNGYAGGQLDCAGPNNLSFPYIFTFDKNLNPLTPFTVIHLPGDLELASTPIFGLTSGMTNTIEDADDPTQIIWGFNITPSGSISTSCDYSHTESASCFLLKQRISDLSITSDREYATNCFVGEIPTVLRNNISEHTFSLGLTELIKVGHGSGLIDLNIKPALMTLDYHLNPLSLHRYNFTDYTVFTQSPYTWQSDFNLFQSFYPFKQDLVHNSFIIHVSGLEYNSPNSYARIIHADLSGDAYCSSTEQVYYAQLEPEYCQFDIESPFDESRGYRLQPSIYAVNYLIDSCTPPPKPAAASIIEENKKLVVYPNPTNGRDLIVEGSIKDNTTFIIENIYGQIVFYLKADKCSQTKLSLGNIVDGVYFLKVLNNGKLEKTKKILVN
jgi:hypothetical protein